MGQVMIMMIKAEPYIGLGVSVYFLCIVVYFKNVHLFSLNLCMCLCYEADGTDESWYVPVL